MFKCQACSQTLFFENVQCEKCGHRLGYIPHGETLAALEAAEQAWAPVHAPAERYRFCANAGHNVCNWLIPAAATDELCLACRHNRTIPDISDPVNQARWQKIEFAKHRLFYSLLKLRLPLQTRDEDPQHGLAFDFLAAPATPDQPPVMTGHDEGVITLALEEGDSAEREGRRLRLHEPYRTLLGHFRHEIGHHYWDLLIRDAAPLEGFRAVFGDERADYGEALKRHYENGPPADWQTQYISAYASVHPWEDFAETWAHYFHIIDCLETAAAFGMELHPATEIADEAPSGETGPDNGISAIINQWLPLTLAVNSMNRSLGQPDLYPFVFSASAVAKLGFVHDLLQAHRRA